jgi:hypothetical protein
MPNQRNQPPNGQRALLLILLVLALAAGTVLYFTVSTKQTKKHVSDRQPGAAVSDTPGPADGKACGHARGAHKIDTVIVISEENRTWDKVGGVGFGAANSPYEHNLAAQCAYFTSDTETDTSDDSAQQYVGAWTGLDHSATHVYDDCAPSASCSYTGNNLFRAFRAAGIPHREYVEDTSAACSAEGNASKHIPELYMWGPADRAACSKEVQPLSQFKFASPPAGFTFITPNLSNDGHNGTDTQRDEWLSDPSRLPALTNSSAYRSGRVLLELWWDEDAPRPNTFACWSCKSGLASSGNPHFSGESLLWLNLLGAPAGNLGAISNAADIRPILGTP